MADAFERLIKFTSRTYTAPRMTTLIIKFTGNIKIMDR